MIVIEKTDQVADQLRALYVKHQKAVAFHSGEAKRCAAALTALGQSIDTVRSEVAGPAAGPARMKSDTITAAKMIADHIRQHGPQQISQIERLGIVSPPTVHKILTMGPFQREPGQFGKWSLKAGTPENITLGEMVTTPKDAAS